jgi:ribosomal protein L11 methyltransferase
MDYIELSCVPCTGQHTSEFLIARLAEIGFESFSEDEKIINAYIPAANFTKDVEEQLSKPELKELLSSYHAKLIADQNWNAVWESEYEPVNIAENCRVRAPFHEKRGDIEFDIVIEPKMSFGTAHHETTRLMMKFLLELDLAGKSVLDMGSGTGVLAILACMKGAGLVTAIDNDSWAYNNAVENVGNNKPGEIQVLLGDSVLLNDRHFDVILANINRNILLNDIPVYAKCLLAEGFLVLSGFYEDDLPSITFKASECGLSFISSKIDNRWTAACYRVLGKKNSNNPG